MEVTLMNVLRRTAGRFGHLLCSLNFWLALGVCALPALLTAQSTAPVSYTVNPYIAFEFLSPPSEILIQVPDGGQAGTYQGQRPFRVRANVTWSFGSYSFHSWSPGPPPYSIGAAGVPGGGGPGELIGNVVVTISGLTFPTPPQTRTGVLTVTINP
jgi:hypothetical protein